MQRRVVLKRLDDDCLLDGELHPSIRRRLERVQQLPLVAVTNLHGVERRGDAVYLLWEFVEGQPLEAVPDCARFEREVRHVVEMLHSHGIIHGALHARNIIIDDCGGVHLMHVSPLLFSDPQIDAAALDAIFGKGEDKLRPYDGDDTAGIRKNALIGAAVAAVAALLITGSVIYFASSPL